MRIKTATTLAASTHNGANVRICAYHPPEVEPETGIQLHGEVEALFANGDLFSLRFPMIDDLDDVPSLVGCTVNAEVYEQMAGHNDLWPWTETRIRFRPDLYCKKGED